MTVFKLLLTTTLAGLLWIPASQAQVMTYDQTTGANTARTAAAVENQVNLLREMKAINENTFRAIGNVGQEAALSDNPAWNDFKNGGKLSESFKTIRANTCGVVACKDAKGGKEAKLDTIQNAKDWINQSFYSSKQATLQDGKNLMEVRKRAERDASFNGYALSLVSRDHLAKAEEHSTKLEDIVSQSRNLRQDIRANTAVTLAQYQNMNHMLALLTSLVEIESTKGLLNDGTILSENGTTAVPNVVNQEELDNSGKQQLILKDAEGNRIK